MAERRAILTARDAARDLIARYVARGDSLESLREGGMGHCGRAYWASIGGCMDTDRGSRCFGPDWIVVTRVMGQPCNERIHLPRLYQEIARELVGDPAYRRRLPHPALPRLLAAMEPAIARLPVRSRWVGAA